MTYITVTCQRCKAAHQVVKCASCGGDIALKLLLPESQQRSRLMDAVRDLPAEKLEAVESLLKALK